MKVADFGGSMFSYERLGHALAVRITDAKTISGPGINDTEMSRFIKTCFVLSDIERDATRIRVWTRSTDSGDEFDSYGLKEYEVDPRFKGLLVPREVVVNDCDYRLQGDLRMHYKFSDPKEVTRILPPGEFEAFQTKVANQFKDSLREMLNVAEIVDRINISAVKNCLSSSLKRIHTDESSELQLPILLTVSDDVFEEDYFDMSDTKFFDGFIKDFVKQFQKKRD